MYKKIQKDLVKSNFNFIEKELALSAWGENELEFHENGNYQFSDSAFRAFQKFNTYIDKTENFSLKIVNIAKDLFLQICGVGQKYAFKINKITVDFSTSKTEQEIFIDYLIKKYKKYIVTNPNFDIKILQKDNRLFIFGSCTTLEIFDSNQLGDFSNSHNKNTNMSAMERVIFNMLGNDFKSNFHFPKSLTYADTIRIDLENEMVYNGIGEKIKIKTSEDVKLVLTLRHDQLFKQMLGENIQICETESKKAFYFKIEKKNFNMYGLLNKEGSI